MIISQTPVRISFVGGGTDIANFYRQCGGAVISTTINKYVSVRITSRQNSQIAINTPHHHETVVVLDHIQHPLIREALRKTDVTGGLSITVTSDVPSCGCGLGSSSALTVGLLNALYAYRGIEVPAETLAHQACEIEIGRLSQPIGKQDQYIVAYGGLRQIQFNSDESVDTQEIPVTPETIARLERNLMLFDTGIQRRAETILHKQKRSASLQNLLQIKELVPSFYDTFVQPFSLSEVGYLLNRAWGLKRSLWDSISNPMLDAIYERAVNAGALGGKILGAGGGGYFLFYVPEAKQQAVTATLSDLGLSRLGFHFEPKGSQIIEGRNLDESHYPYRRERHATQTPHFRFSSDTHTCRGASDPRLLLEPLVELPDHSELIFIVGDKGEQIRGYVETYWDLPATYLWQNERKGLGHAISLAKERDNGEPVLILLGDKIFERGYQKIFQSPYTVIGVKRGENPQASGVVEVEGEFITRLIEKPENPPTNLVIGGVYYIQNSELLFHCLDETIERDIRTHNEYQLTDRLQLMLEYGEQMKVEFIHSLHCGTPDQLLDANRSILEKRTSQIYRFPNSVIIPPVFIGEGAVIEGAIIGPYASIGGGTRIINVIIKDVIIAPNAEVQDVLINRSLIGPDARVYGGFHQFNVGSSAQINLQNLL